MGGGPCAMPGTAEEIQSPNVAHSPPSSGQVLVIVAWPARALLLRGVKGLSLSRAFPDT